LYFRVGNTTFGGGDPTMAALQRELVEQKHWLTREDFALAYSLARITPGTNIIAFCAATAVRILGVWGAIAAVLAETAPSAVLAVLLTLGFESWAKNPVMMAAIAGTVAAVTGMMWASVWLLVRPYLSDAMSLLRVVLLGGGAFLAAWKFGVTPVPVIVSRLRSASSGGIPNESSGGLSAAAQGDHDVVQRARIAGVDPYRLCGTAPRFDGSPAQHGSRWRAARDRGRTACTSSAWDISWRAFRAQSPDSRRW
jgi:chromate transporter